ncbi:MAG: hypothetical protein J7L15_05875 [Clostridiales bacterium]|nr:hypothetical protein [Clostridiales bacterium]
MTKFGIDIVDKYGYTPAHLRGHKYFNTLSEAKRWGNKQIGDNYSVAFGFMIFKEDTDEVLYHSFSEIQKKLEAEIEKKKKKISRFELMDLE